MKKPKKNSSLYFIAIIPPDEISEKVTAIKKYFAESFNSKGALKSPPHITLHMPFWWKSKKEEELVDFLKDFALRQEPFKVELKNFGAFPKRVIFVDIVKNDHLTILYKNLTRDIRSHLKIMKESYKNRGYNPHMTVAFKDLKPQAFTAAWPEFKERIFEYKFMVDNIILLKHNTKFYDFKMILSEIFRKKF